MSFIVLRLLYCVARVLYYTSYERFLFCLSNDVVVRGFRQEI